MLSNFIEVDHFDVSVMENGLEHAENFLVFVAIHFKDRQKSLATSHSSSSHLLHSFIW